MAKDLLARIVEGKQQEIALLAQRTDIADWPARAKSLPARFDFRAALARPGRIRVIAEIKRQSPSAGLLQEIPAPAKLAQIYEAAGADAISVLTDGPNFGGSIADLAEVSKTVAIPTLRKEFILDPLQVYEAKIAGAAACLLIAECLDAKTLAKLVALIHELNMTALVELYEIENLPAVLASGATVVGVNNRNLKTLQIDIEHSLRIRDRVPPDRIFVSESGIKTAAEVARLHSAGVNAILVGETLLRAENPSQTLQLLVSPTVSLE